MISAAEITNADAIHPGYGFLSENADFAEVCETSGLDLHRPQAGRDSPHGPETSGANRDGRSGRADSARFQGNPEMRGRSAGDRRDNRLSGDAEGIGGRRRPRHAGSAKRGGASRAARAGAERKLRRHSPTAICTWRSWWRIRAISSFRFWPTSMAMSRFWASANAPSNGVIRS